MYDVKVSASKVNTVAPAAKIKAFLLGDGNAEQSNWQVEPTLPYYTSVGSAGQVTRWWVF